LIYYSLLLPSRHEKWGVKGNKTSIKETIRERKKNPLFLLEP